MASNGSQRPAGSRTSSGKTGGRVSERVYRRRRLAALIVLALVAALVLWGVSTAVRAVTGAGEDPQPAGPPAVAASPSVNPDDKFADFTPRPTPSASDGKKKNTATPSPSAAEQCGEHLDVKASTDRQSYPAEQKPVLILTLENTGDTACEVDAGTDQMAYVVTSGPDTVFDSRHCAAPGEDRKITLQPGKSENARLTWDRTRTAGGCPAAQAQAGAGYYHLTVSLGDRQSSQAQFALQ